MSDDLERLVADIPASLKFLVDEEEGTIRENVIAALEQYLGVSEAESEAVIRRKIKRKERRFEDRREDVEEAKSELSDLRNQIERLRDIMQSKEEAQEQYLEALDDLLDELQAGEINSVFPEHGKVASIAAEFDATPPEVIWDLKKRAVDQERGLYNSHFMDTYQTSADFEEQPLEETFEGGDRDE